MKSRTFAQSALAIIALLVFAPANAVIYEIGTTMVQIDLPQGDLSFADEVVSFQQGPTDDGPPLDAKFSDPLQALGPPDVEPTISFAAGCAFGSLPEQCRFTSLGNGGVITLLFTDNVLTGSSDTGVADGFDDLYVIEVGEREATTVEISKNGMDWTTVGNITDTDEDQVDVFVYGFDIDAFGFGFDDMFTHVRLTDSGLGLTSNPEGFDVDAIGAIQSFAIPIPAVAWLFPAGLIAGLGWMRRQAN